MKAEIPTMKGSVCPFCKSLMFMEQEDETWILRCADRNCRYNIKEERDAYFREKHRKIIVGDVLHKVKGKPKLVSMIDDEEDEEIDGQ